MLVASPDAREYPFIFGVGNFFLPTPKMKDWKGGGKPTQKKSLMFTAPNF